VRFIGFIEDISIVGLHPLSNPLLVPVSAVAPTHLLGDLLLCPTLLLSIGNLLAGCGTKLPTLVDRSSGCQLLGSLAGQQSTRACEFSNLGVNRGLFS
jgi:hypothetical protein